MKRTFLTAATLLACTFLHAQEKKDTVLELIPVEVKAIRAGSQAPFTKTDLNKAQIEKLNLGQDIPFLLNYTPSVIINSDAGNGVGYTGIRIRGTDATRINMTINGIPYNDAESQGLFFVNLPDFSSSVNSIQIQRGVGTSSNGAGAFGATMNFSTNEKNNQAYAEVNNAFGSFNTWKNTLKAGSGLLGNKFTIDTRFSRIKSDGYIDRARSDLKSLYLSTAYYGKNSTLRFNLISGKEETYQAWNGISEADYKAGKYTYNSSGTDKPGEPYENEIDLYQQTHFQLFYDQHLNENLTYNIAAFLTKGNGHYEQYKADQAYSKYDISQAGNTDLIRRLGLDNDFYGVIFSLQHKTDKAQTTWGGAVTKYKGDHIGSVIWASNGLPTPTHQWYKHPANKLDINSYIKEQYSINDKWSLFGDLQYRHVNYEIDGFRDNPNLSIANKYHFMNPKVGVHYQNNGWKSYFSYGLANKEPNRDDFEASDLQMPQPEQLHDFEMGLEKRTAQSFVAATVYYMHYKDQLVLTGKINDVGAYTRINIPKSFRAGIELQAAHAFNKWINANVNFTFSKNKIKELNSFIDDYDNGGQIVSTHKNTDIALSPNFISSYQLNILPFKNAEISLLGKGIGQQYLDNTQSKDRMLEGYYVQDIRASYSLENSFFKNITFIAQVNNLFNKRYIPNGYTFSYLYGGEIATENYYFPMAGTNFMIGLSIKL